MKDWLAKTWIPALVVLAIVFGIVLLQKGCDERAVKKQTEQLQKYELEKQASRDKQQELLDKFNEQHERTVDVLNALKAMNGTINQLIESDRQQDAEVKNLREEYLNARNPTTVKTNSALPDRRRNLSLRQRENDVLANDRQLYPNGN